MKNDPEQPNLIKLDELGGPYKTIDKQKELLKELNSQKLRFHDLADLFPLSTFYLSPIFGPSSAFASRSSKP
jgi:hypothetical protein